jgi:hypothetical protein
MSSVRDVVYIMLTRYPSLFLTKNDCFKWLFLDGVGYRWINGELDDGKKPETISALEDDSSDDLQARQARFAIENIDLILEDLIDFDDFNFVSEFAPLLHVPDDVKPDWEGAVYEAMRALMIAIENRKRPTIRERNLANESPEIQRRMRDLHGRFFASDLTDPLFEPD